LYHDARIHEHQVLGTVLKNWKVASLFTNLLVKC